MIKPIDEMTREEMNILDDFIQTFIVHSEKCQNCQFCHSSEMCFFAYECLLNDFKNFIKKP